MISYELCKILKDAGFTGIYFHCINKDESHACRCDKPDCKVRILHAPTLSELVEACGDRTNVRLQSYWSDNDLMWQADTSGNFRDYDQIFDKAGVGSSPEEAVARLFISLNKK